MIQIEFDVIVFREDKSYVTYCPEFDISSCGKSVEHAKEMLRTAIRLFLEETEKMGTLEEILEEAGYKKDVTGKWLPPKLVAIESVTL